MVSALAVSLFATSYQDWPAAKMIPFFAPHPISFRLSAEADGVNCSADSQATSFTDADGNTFWLVAGPQSILGGEQLDLTCTVSYSVGAETPSILNVSLNGQDHCYTYLAPPTQGTGQPVTGQPVTGTAAPPTTTFVDQPDYCCGSWGSYLMEDDQQAGKATSMLSVIACTNYTDGVQIALR